MTAFDDWETKNRTGHLLGGAPPETGLANGGAHGGEVIMTRAAGQGIGSYAEGRSSLSFPLRGGVGGGVHEPSPRGDPPPRPLRASSARLAPASVGGIKKSRRFQFRISNSHTACSDTCAIGHMVRDARRCRAPHHEGVPRPSYGPHPEERRFRRVSKDASTVSHPHLRDLAARFRPSDA